MIHLVLGICMMTVFILFGYGSCSCSDMFSDSLFTERSYQSSYQQCEPKWAQSWCVKGLDTRMILQALKPNQLWSGSLMSRQSASWKTQRLLSAGRSAVTPTIFRRGGTIFSSTIAVSLTTRQELSATWSPYCDLTSLLHLKREFPEIFTTCHPNIWEIWPQSPSCRLAAAKLSNICLTTILSQKNQGDICWIAGLDAAGLTQVVETLSSSGTDSRVAWLHWKQHVASFPSGFHERRKARGQKRKWNITTFPVLCDVLVFGGHHGNETLTPAASLCSQKTADFQKQRQQRHISLPYLTDNNSCLKPRPVLVVSIKRHEAIVAACTSMCHMTAPSFLLSSDR